jgi:hypothetical protein
MRRHRLSGPDGTDFLRGVIAYGEKETELGRSRLCQFISALASETGSGNVRGFQLPDCFGASGQR